MLLLASALLFFTVDPSLKRYLHLSTHFCPCIYQIPQGYFCVLEVIEHSYFKLLSFLALEPPSAAFPLNSGPSLSLCSFLQPHMYYLSTSTWLMSHRCLKLSSFKIDSITFSIES